MEYTLMHKNVPVVDMVIDETGFIAKLTTTHNELHLPVGINIFSSGIDRKGLNDWWLGRSIPASRDGLDDALAMLELSSPKLLIEKCFGLSLSDHYWICPRGSGLVWENVNFFTNTFSKDVGAVLFGQEPENQEQISLVSPDNTSDGWLKKKWIILDDKRYLMKGGSGVYQQEPFNEVIASAVMRKLGVPHVDYTLTFDNEKPFSLCENFVTPTTELIPAWRVRASLKKVNQDSSLSHLYRCCEGLGIPGVIKAINQMLTIDFIIANEDRHYNNFGFIRNADTLEWIGVAPIYDSGTSLWYNSARVGQKTASKPFYATNEEQIKRVLDFKWFDMDALEGIDDIVISTLSQSPDIDESRANAIAKIILDRAGRIEQLSREKPSLTASLEANQAKVKPHGNDGDGVKP